MKSYDQTSEVSMTTEDVAWDLKAPCDDCPFKRTTPLHSGVYSSLLDYHNNLMNRIMAHTCHKTDPRADGYVESYQNKPQHCFGALVMFHNMEKSCGEESETAEGYPATQGALLHALINGVSLDNLNHPEVFTSFGEMLIEYEDYG